MVYTIVTKKGVAPVSEIELARQLFIAACRRLRSAVRDGKDDESFKWLRISNAIEEGWPEVASIDPDCFTEKP